MVEVFPWLRSGVAFVGTRLFPVGSHWVCDWTAERADLISGPVGRIAELGIPLWQHVVEEMYGWNGGKKGNWETKVDHEEKVRVHQTE